MRFSTGQTLYVVNFAIAGRSKVDQSIWFTYPFLYDDAEVEAIRFEKLVVMEHHKVAWSQDPKEEKKYDGFILKNEEGAVFHNQYPYADYGQTSDEGDRRFERAGVEFSEVEHTGLPIVSYHLLSDYMGNLERGIRKLPTMGDGNAEYVARLTTLKERIISEFATSYPGLALTVVDEQAFKDSDFKWPKGNIVEVK